MGKETVRREIKTTHWRNVEWRSCLSARTNHSSSFCEFSWRDCGEIYFYKWEAKILPFKEKWQILRAAFWKGCKHTQYGSALSRYFDQISGLFKPQSKDLSDFTFRKLNSWTNLQKFIFGIIILVPKKPTCFELSGSNWELSFKSSKSDSRLRKIWIFSFKQSSFLSI